MGNKKRLFFKIISIVLIIYILTMSIGYAFFSETLNINGIASTSIYYTGNTLPVDKVILNTSNNRYYSQEGSKSGISFSSENWTDDTYTLTMKKGFLTSSGSSTIKYTIAVENNTAVTFTDGNVSTSIVEDTGSSITDASTTIDKTTLNPGETLYITLTMSVNIRWRYNTETAKADVSFMVQGKRRHIYFVVTYTT